MWSRFFSQQSMLRGRGGCYKHAFYGIASHQCMEATPSLACANKCVFCWRHHTNPVGTEWRWQMDDPEMLINGALQNHTNLIKQFKGVCMMQHSSVLSLLFAQECLGCKQSALQREWLQSIARCLWSESPSCTLKSTASVNCCTQKTSHRSSLLMLNFRRL